MTSPVEEEDWPYGPCYVCGKKLDDTEPHTFHADGCPARVPCIREHDCYDLSGCGEDVHEECCPTCNPEPQ